MPPPGNAFPLHLLFICSQNKLRSPTAEEMYRNFPGYEARSAGIDAGCRQRVTEGLINWADRIFVMESKHRSYLQRRFSDAIERKAVICLRIPDDYEFNDPELIKLLKANLSPHISVPH